MIKRQQMAILAILVASGMFASYACNVTLSNFCMGRMANVICKEGGATLSRSKVCNGNSSSFTAVVLGTGATWDQWFQCDGTGHYMQNYVPSNTCYSDCVYQIGYTDPCTNMYTEQWETKHCPRACQGAFLENPNCLASEWDPAAQAQSSCNN